MYCLISLDVVCAVYGSIVCRGHNTFFGHKIFIKLRWGLLCRSINFRPSKVIALIKTFSVYFCRDLGTYALQNVGLIDASTATDAHNEICENVLHLTLEQRRICGRSPRLFTVNWKKRLSFRIVLWNSVCVCVSGHFNGSQNGTRRMPTSISKQPLELYIVHAIVWFSRCLRWHYAI